MGTYFAYGTLDPPPKEQQKFWGLKPENQSGRTFFNKPFLTANKIFSSAQNKFSRITKTTFKKISLQDLYSVSHAEFISASVKILNQVQDDTKCVSPIVLFFEKRLVQND